jgi:hypothetical protein
MQGGSSVNTRFPWWLNVAVFGVATVAASTCWVLAQQRARPGARPGARVQPRSDVVRIRRLTGVGRQYLVKTPVYRTNQSASTKRVGEWAQITVTYDTQPEWIDELVIQYHALTLDKDKGGNAYSLYRKVVRYADVERDRNHMGTAFLHPRTLARYGDVVAVAVEISVEGKLTATEAETDPGVRLPAEWWRNPVVLQSKNVEIRDGYLLSRPDTPFAFVNVDDYEVVK